MPKVKVAKEIVQTSTEMVPLMKALVEEPGATINFLLHQPGFVAIFSSILAFFLVRLWDLIRNNSRETAKSAMLSIISDYTQRQTEREARYAEQQASRERMHDEKIMGIVAEIERESKESMIEVVKISTKLDRFDLKFDHMNTRIDKLERLTDADR